MSDRFDTDPDDVLESENQPGKQAENRYDTEPRRPSVRVPEPPVAETDATDVDPALRTLFWKLVFAIKFALLSLTLGSLLFVFEGSTVLGGQLLAFGLLLSGYAVYRYRRGKARIAAGEFDTDGEEP